MFDFLAEDDAELLMADYEQHGHYRDALIKALRADHDEIDRFLVRKKYPTIRSGQASQKSKRNNNQQQQATPSQIEDLLEHVVPQKEQNNHNNPDGPVGKENGTKRPATELDKQRTALSFVLDYHDKRPIRVKLKDIGVTTYEYQEWLKDHNFQTILRKELDARFKNLDIDAKLGLSKLVLDGDLNAIKYYYEFTGLYRPQSETQVNLTVIIAKLMDILVRHVEPESLDMIAGEIESAVFQAGVQ